MFSSVFEQVDQQLPTFFNFEQSILDSFKDRTQMVVLYTDLEKAFSRVNHKFKLLL